jgi:hypothetical protein
VLYPDARKIAAADVYRLRVIKRNARSINLIDAFRLQQQRLITANLR